MNEKQAVQECAFCEMIRATYPEGVRIEKRVSLMFEKHLANTHGLIA